MSASIGENETWKWNGKQQFLLGQFCDSQSGQLTLEPFALISNWG